jgi:hypothetical protein
MGNSALRRLLQQTISKMKLSEWSILIYVFHKLACGYDDFPRCFPPQAGKYDKME